MTDELKQAAQQALEALEHAEKDVADFQRLNTDQTSVAIKALRQALTAAQPAQAGEVDAKCQTCNGHGLVGGHMQDGSGYGEGCPDCNPEPAPLVKWASTQPAAQTDSMGMPTSCGKPLCLPDEHHPLCKLHKPAAQDTPEPVGEVRIAHYGGRSRSIGFSTIALLVDIETLPVGTKLYTHPAPGVPEGWRDAKNDPPPVGLDVLVAVEFDRPGDWRIKVGGRNPQERTGWCVFGASWVPQVWMPLDAHRAMLAAAQAKGADHG